MVMDMSALINKASAWLLSNGFQIVLVWALALVIVFLSNRYSKKLVLMFSRKSEHPEFRKRSDSLGLVIRYAVDIIALSVAAIVTLKTLGIDTGPILTAAGIVGIAAGLGGQRLVQDIISGFFILLEDQIRVGDVVDIDGRSGAVESVNLRMTVLRDLTGSVIFIRNSNIGIVRNMTKDFSRYVFDIGVSYSEDVDEVMEVIREVDKELRADPEYARRMLEPIEILGLDRFEDSAVIIRARTKTVPTEQWNVGREFNRRLKKAFDEHGIEMPFPHRTLYMGVDKDGKSPPLNIRQKGEPGA